MRNNSRQIDIEGYPLTKGALALKLMWAALWMAAALFCFSRADTPETGAMWGFGGLMPLLVSLLCLHHEHYYIDVYDRQIVRRNWYAGVESSPTTAPLDDFSKIVAHHVCHPGGEGEDTFTGSVGLKPKNGKAIVWVKSFPATKEEMPREPDEFARELAEKVGLPYHARGTE